MLLDPSRLFADEMSESFHLLWLRHDEAVRALAMWTHPIEMIVTRPGLPDVRGRFRYLNDDRGGQLESTLIAENGAVIHGSSGDGDERGAE